MGARSGTPAVALQGLRVADCETWEEAVVQGGDESAVLLENVEEKGEAECGMNEAMRSTEFNPKPEIWRTKLSPVCRGCLVSRFAKSFGINPGVSGHRMT
jgi:hypothetical protein